MAGEQILIIEDEAVVRDTLRRQLEREGYEVGLAADGAEGRAQLARTEFDLLLLDNRLPDTTGLELLGELAAAGSLAELPVLLMTAHGSVSDAITAIQTGARDYLVKPFEAAELRVAVAKALETTQLRREVRALREGQRDRFGIGQVIGTAAAIEELMQVVEKIVAHGSGTVLILGESGTGKDLLARTIHDSGPRADAPYMTITCSAMPEQLLESQLFGHERGAFTDAREQKKGLLEVARGGTLLLDEIGDMPLSLQAKLLHFLEERRFKRLGGTSEIKVDVQVIAATWRDLAAMVAEGTFRNDLYYRLNVIKLRMPSLRERKCDVPLIAAHFIDVFNREFGRHYHGVSSDALTRLERYDWPGNIRELRNVIERAFIVGDGETIREADLPVELRDPVASRSDGGGRLLELPAEGVDLPALEEHFLRQALERTDGNQTRAADLLGLTRDQVKYRLKQLRHSGT